MESLGRKQLFYGELAELCSPSIIRVRVWLFTCYSNCMRKSYAFAKRRIICFECECELGIACCEQGRKLLKVTRSNSYS